MKIKCDAAAFLSEWDEETNTWKTLGKVREVEYDDDAGEVRCKLNAIPPRTGTFSVKLTNNASHNAHHQ